MNGRITGWFSFGVPHEEIIFSCSEHKEVNACPELGVFNSIMLWLVGRYMSSRTSSSAGKTPVPPSDGGNGILPQLAPSSPERWSPQKKSAARTFLDDQIQLRLSGNRLNHAYVMKEIKELVRDDNPQAYVPNERLVFNYIRREQDKQKR